MNETVPYDSSNSCIFNGYVDDLDVVLCSQLIHSYLSTGLGRAVDLHNDKRASFSCRKASEVFGSWVGRVADTCNDDVVILGKIISSQAKAEA